MQNSIGIPKSNPLQSGSGHHKSVDKLTWIADLLLCIFGACSITKSNAGQYTETDLKNKTDGEDDDAMEDVHLLLVSVLSNLEYVGGRSASAQTKMLHDVETIGKQISLVKACSAIR